MEFDLTLKSVIQSPDSMLVRHYSGRDRAEWLNVELPRVDLLRPDLVARLDNGELFHLEINSRNLPMGPRMLEYYGRIWNVLGQPPRQRVLYVGKEPLNMAGLVQHDDLTYRYAVSDIRELDAELLLRSECLEDNVLAVLCKMHDAREVVRRILSRISRAAPERRSIALGQFLVISGLRPLEAIISEERKFVPITVDLMENPFLREFYDKGEAKGREEAEISHREFASSLLRRFLSRRFPAALPDWAESRISLASTQQLEAWCVRALSAASVEDVLVP